MKSAGVTAANPQHAAVVAIFTDTAQVPPQVLDGWRGDLCQADQLRASVFGSPQRYRQFILGRRVLAQLLADHLGLAPAEVLARIVRLSDGRPALSQSALHCSISHSRDTVMAGISLYGQLGVDVEHHRQRRFAGLVETYFHPQEAAHFACLEPQQQMAWFYRLWTRKEARIKAQGGSLGRRTLGAAEADSEYHLSSCAFSHFSVSIACQVDGPMRLHDVRLGEGGALLLSPGRIVHDAPPA